MSAIPVLTISSLLCVTTGVATNVMAPTYMGMALSGVAIGMPLLRSACDAWQAQRGTVAALPVASPPPRLPPRITL